MTLVSRSPAHDLPDHLQPSSLRNVSEQQHYTPKALHVFCGRTICLLSHEVTCNQHSKVLPVVCQSV